MRWLKYLGILLVTMLLSAVLLAIGALIFLDGDDYKQPLAWVARSYFDSELTISGPLKVHVSGELQIQAERVQLKPHDDSYLLAADSLNAHIRLKDAIFGLLWVRDLALTGFYLKINEAETSEKIDWENFTLPPVVVERADFKNLVIEYQEYAPGTLHRFALSELAFDDVNDSGPVRLQAQGQLEGRSLSIDGTFPPLAVALDHQSPKPVVITVEGERLHARLDGTITDPANGEGLDLEIEFQAPAVHELLEIFADGIPTVGELQASARLQGDYAVPRLVDIDAHLQREQEVELKLTGSVDDMLTGKGMNLHLAGHSNHPAVTSWLLFKQLDTMESLGFDGLIQENNGHYYLKEVAASAKTTDGLSVMASGDGELYDKGHVFSAADDGLVLKVSAPTTAAMNLLHVKEVPELGAVSGELKLMVSQDALGLYDTNVNIGSKNTSAAHFKGQVGNIPLHDAAGTTGLDLQVNIKSSNVTALAKKFGYELPSLGPGHADTHIRGDLENIRLGQTVVSVGRKDGLFATVKGSADSIVFGEQGLQGNAHFDVAASMPDLSDLSDIAGTDLPELGATAISSDLVIRNSELKFENLNINIGATDQPTIRVNGKVVTLLQKGSTIDVRFDVAVGDLAAALTGKPPGYLGRLQGTAGISDIDGSWGVEKFTLQSSDTHLYKIDIGGYKKLDKSEFIKVKAKIDINDPPALGRALDIDLSGYGSYRSEGILTSPKGSLDYSATASVGRTTSTTTVNGTLVNGRPTFKGKFEIPVLYLSDFGFNPIAEDEEPVKVDLDSTGSGDIFSRAPFNISYLNDFDLDFDFLIDKVESHGEMSMDGVNAHIRLKNGDLQVEPLKFIYEGGTMDIIFALQAHDTPSLSLKVTADDLKLGPMMAQVQNDVPISGYSNIKVDITASGQSPHEMAASIDGKIDLGFENARVPKKYIQFLSVDVLGWAMSNTFRKKEKYADLNCVVAAFEAHDGNITSTLLISDGPNLSLGGSIRLNLGKETMNIVLLPKQKRKLFSSISPVKIHGPMRNPVVEAVPTKAAMQQIGAMALVPYVYVPLKLVSNLWGIMDDGDKSGQGCASVNALTEEAEKKLLEETQK